MAEGVLFLFVFQLIGFHPEEGPARSREQDLGQGFGALGVLQALEDGRVLAVHRQQLDAMLFHRLGDQVPAGDKALLVGQGQVVAALDGGQGGPQSGNAHHAVQHHVRPLHGGQLPQALGAAQQQRRAGTAGQGGVQLLGGRRVGDADGAGMEFFDLRKQQVHMAVGRQAEYLKPLGPNHVQALGADGAGGPQQGDLLCHRAAPPFQL